MSNNRPVLIHLHVPKCAGSSVNRAIGDRFRPRCTGLTRDAGARQRFLNMTPERRDELFDAVFGHLHFGEHRLFTRPCVYISATRDPIERICSFFNFLHTRVEHHAHEHIRAVLRDLNEFNEEHVEDELLRRLWSDAFCRVYAGPGAGRGEYENVRRRVVHLVRANRLLAGPLPVVVAFLREIGIPELPRLNVTDTTAAEDFVPASPETLDPSVRKLLTSTFCKKDYDLLNAIEEARTMSGEQFAQVSGLAQAWI